MGGLAWGCGSDVEGPQRAADPVAATDAGMNLTDAGALDAAVGGDAAPTPDAVPDVGPCSPDEVVAETLALQPDPADATLEADADTGTFTLDAALGGPVEAASSSWVYVDLLGESIVPIADTEAVDDDRWTLAFKRTEIRTNSGDSGPATWMVSRVEDTTFAEATASRDAAWATDDFVDDVTCEVRTEGRGTPATAFGIWYDYDPMTHAVSAPEGVVYVLYDATTHAALKLEIVDYADGVYTLRWGAVGE